MRVTVLSTYPSLKPLHGGQHRLANMISALSADGHDVRSVGVLGSDHYTASPGFLPFPGYTALARYIENPFLMEDWAIGQLALKDSSAFTALGKMVGSTDVILCEQPWLFGFAQRFRDSFKKNKPRIFYGSQNIESRLKREIAARIFDDARAVEFESLVLEVEENAIANADLIFTVSQSDAEWTSAMTAAPIFVAPNGVTESRPSVQDVIAANAIAGHRKFALYVASAHPPNVTGFFDIFGAGVGCFSPDERLIVAGSAGQSIRSDPKFAKVAGLERCFSDTGTISDAQLRGLLYNAHCIILPMMSGGGTNLKTAEALWSGRPVIATEVAMRGFERFAGKDGVIVCADKIEFLHELQQSLSRPRANSNSVEPDELRSLLWSETLKPMVDAFRRATN